MTKVLSYSIGCFFTHLTVYFVVWSLLNFLRFCLSTVDLSSEQLEFSLENPYVCPCSVVLPLLFLPPRNFRVSDLTFRCLMHVDMTFVQVRYTVLVPLLHEDIFSSTTCWGCCLFSNVHFWNFVKSQGDVVIWAYTLPSSLVHWLTHVNALLLLLPRLCRVAQSQV